MDGAVMNARFTLWGNSLAVRIPSGVAKELHVFDGKAAELEIRDGSLIVTPVDVVPTYDINKLVAAITPENLHGETDTGEPVGKEFA
jgi:antitoxin MazE